MRLTTRGVLVVYGVPIVLVLLAGLLVVAGHEPGGADPARAAAASPTPMPTPSAPGSPVVTRSPVPSPSATPSRSSSRPASRSIVPRSGTGRLAVVPGRSAVHGRGVVRRFTVEVEQGIGEDGRVFAAAVERVLFDPRSWIGGGGAMQRVDSGAVAFRVVLASPALTDRLCAPLDTGGSLSCFKNGRSVLNLLRWRNGAVTYGGDLASYRIYLVNHEVGHALGRGHRGCPARGRPAPVMMQQTKGLGGCRANPWPLPAER